MTSPDPLSALVATAAAEGVRAALEPLVEALRDQGRGPRPLVWTADEAAVVLGVTSKILRRWVATGQIDRLPGVDKVLIPHLAIERFLDPDTRKQV